MPSIKLGIEGKEKVAEFLDETGLKTQKIADLCQVGIEAVKKWKSNGKLPLYATKILLPYLAMDTAKQIVQNETTIADLGFIKKYAETIEKEHSSPYFFRIYELIEQIRLRIEGE